MRFEKAYIPAGFAWSSPFARWQGALAEVNSLDLAVDVTRAAFERRGFSAEGLTGLVLGWTVPQRDIFYGAPSVAARIGTPGVTGPMISQACATSVACIHSAAATAEGQDSDVTLVVTTDRTSNGPQVVYPKPSAPGGSPEIENWVQDSFARDPWAGEAMFTTGELIAFEEGITREELDDITAMRYEQYERALENDREFQKRYMVPVTIPRKRKDPVVVDEDAGVFPTTREGLAKLKPMTEGGVVTFGSQTHPADGTAGLIVTGEEKARELGGGEGVVKLLATGFARVAKARMPKAPVPAAEMALADAGISISEVDVIKTHNPFAVNDAYFARRMGVQTKDMNNYGSSLIFGHPQGPTGARLIAEMIEELRMRGGGTGLFTGCAAGDSGAALVVRAED
ncbi:MAG: thiolase family protein [Actinomycetota bacterium]|nr:thiolase family protein [Actinomycetota bacterium]